MKKRWGISALLLAMVLLMAGCKKEELTEQPMVDVIMYSHLTGSNSVGRLETIMTEAGIDKERQQILLEHIQQVNRMANTANLADTLTRAHLYETFYAKAAVQAEWENTYPNFPGYNSRIMTFSLFAPFMEISSDAAGKEEGLETDLLALQLDSSVLFGKETVDQFKVLFSLVEGKDTANTEERVAAIQQDWEERGIHFLEKEEVKMISMIFPTEAGLQIGHTGLLFPVEESKEEVVYFLEKISFQEPYKLIKLKNRVELSDYLMYTYGNLLNTSGDSPFIMENDQLMEGYRLLPEQIEE